MCKYSSLEEESPLMLNSEGGRHDHNPSTTHESFDIDIIFAGNYDTEKFVSLALIKLMLY